LLQVVKKILLRHLTFVKFSGIAVSLQSLQTSHRWYEVYLCGSLHGILGEYYELHLFQWRGAFDSPSKHSLKIDLY